MNSPTANGCSSTSLSGLLRFLNRVHKKLCIDVSEECAAPVFRVTRSKSGHWKHTARSSETSEEFRCTPPPVETRKLAFLFLNESIMKRDETVTVVVAEWLMTIRYFHNTKHTNAAARIPWAQTQRPLAPKFYCEIPHPLLWAGSRISCAKTRVTDIIIAHFYRTHIIYPDLHSEYLTSEPLAGSEHFKIGQLIRTVKYANDLGLQAKKGTVLQGITDILTEIEKRYKIKLL